MISRHLVSLGIEHTRRFKTMISHLRCIDMQTGDIIVNYIYESIIHHILDGIIGGDGHDVDLLLYGMDECLNSLSITIIEEDLPELSDIISSLSEHVVNTFNSNVLLNDYSYLILEAINHDYIIVAEYAGNRK